MRRFFDNRTSIIVTAVGVIIIILIFSFGANNLIKTDSNKNTSTVTDLSDTEKSDKNSVANNEIKFSDIAIEKMIRLKLNKIEGSISQADLDNISELYIWGQTSNIVTDYDLITSGGKYKDSMGNEYSSPGEVKSLEDLKLLRNLKDLTLCYQSISDFSGLENLTNLESLTLTGNRIKGISFLKGLKSLKKLLLDYNEIDSMTGIEEFKDLEYLDLSYNRIAKLSGLKKNKALKTLILNQVERRPQDLVRIKDLSPLTNLKSLESISFLNQDIKDLRPVSRLANLKSIDIRNNDISDFSPLRNLRKLQSLKIKSSNFNSHNLAFLRNLPDLKETDIEESEWKKINYPFDLNESDAVEGIYSGNIVNGGAAACDGKYVYYRSITYGDLGHPELVRFDNKELNEENISGEITEQVGAEIGQQPGGEIDERISFLNIYKGRLYFVGNGNNNSTAKVLGDGTYYAGDEVSGLYSMNTDGTDRIILSKDKCSFVCVANDRIYCLNKDNYPASMGLDGKDVQVLQSKPCKMLFTDGEIIYFQLEDPAAGIFTMNLDGTNETVLLKGYCMSPVFLDNDIYYLNKDRNICCYSTEKQEESIVYKGTVDFFNIAGDYIFFSNTNGIFRIDKSGKNTKQIFSGHAAELNVFGSYIVFDNGEGYCKIKSDGSEYTEYFYN